MAHPFWPLFDLEIRTPRLTLRMPNDDELVTLVGLIDRGIHEPDQMPFYVDWTSGESPKREQSALQYHWGNRADLKAEDWRLEFGVWFDGELVGCQGIHASKFTTTRTVETGSWIVQSAQGQGIGKEMRASVLAFAFETLNADEATTDAYDWNARSIGVTESLGYEPNGTKLVTTAVNEQGRVEAFRMSRARWESSLRGQYSVEVSGAEPCLELLGAK
jgi:RimJ/RimL family protein N-acetyltransferase